MGVGAVEGEVGRGEVVEEGVEGCESRRVEDVGEC